MDLQLTTILSFFMFSFLVRPSNAQIQIESAFPSLSFTRPVDLQHAGDGTDRIFVVEQAGRILVFPNDRDATTSEVFLDIRGRVNNSGNEEGLLGLAFHPDYENNGYFFADYTASSPRRTVIAQFNVDGSNPNRADPNSILVILEVNQPFSNHNGGQIAFGPDGFLYISLGDGGSAGDPGNNGQNRQTLLGSILRIDVDNPAGGKNYSIPSDNPFVGNSSSFREEIYAFGLRNPWRFSFDPANGRLWAADVGQNRFEEIDIIENGKNYGWRIMEASSCFNPSSGCNVTGLQLPIWEYSHGVGNSVTGGYVYHGPGRPELDGAYIYADFGSGRIWFLRYDGVNPAENTELLDTSLLISSFGVDQQGELYICAFDGRLYRFKPATTDTNREADLPGQYELQQNYPNPFQLGRKSTAIQYSLAQSGNVEIRIYNLKGELVSTLIGRNQPAGSFRVDWDGRNVAGTQLASGLYFYRLIVDGVIRQTQRMILLR
jgi:glucose/arabinose dehydrogenase